MKLDTGITVGTVLDSPKRNFGSRPDTLGLHSWKSNAPSAHSIRAEWRYYDEYIDSFGLRFYDQTTDPFELKEWREFKRIGDLLTKHFPEAEIRVDEHPARFSRPSGGREP